MKDLALSTMKRCNCCLKVDCYMDGKWLYEWFTYKAFVDIIFNKYVLGKTFLKKVVTAMHVLFLKKTYQDSSELSI